MLMPTLLLIVKIACEFEIPPCLAQRIYSFFQRCISQSGQNVFTNIGLGRFSTLGGSNNCKRNEQTERLREAFTGIPGGWPPGGAPLPKKIVYFAS